MAGRGGTTGPCMGTLVPTRQRSLSGGRWWPLWLTAAGLDMAPDAPTGFLRASAGIGGLPCSAQSWEQMAVQLYGRFG